MRIKATINPVKWIPVCGYFALIACFLRQNGTAPFAVWLIGMVAVLLAFLQVESPPEKTKNVSAAAVVLASVVLFFITQMQLGAGVGHMSARYIVMGVLMCLAMTLVFVWVTGRVMAGIVISSVLLMGLTQADDMIYQFRGTELMPGDFLSIGTGLNVAQEYHYILPEYSVSAIGTMVLTILLLSTVRYEKIDRKKTAVKCGVSTVGALLIFMGLAAGQTSYRWDNGGMYYRGFLTNFALELKESHIKKPAMYSAADLAGGTTEYIDSDDGRDPNIIVIMNEAFADLDDFGNGDFTDLPVMPFIDSLEQDTVRGNAMSSVYGGGTHCSEFEFLTGNTMAFLPPGSVPYQQFLREGTFSMVAVLKQFGYYCEGMHPYYGNGWNRDKTYPVLGFDKVAFLDAFPQENLIRGYESDREMYEYIISEYERLEDGAPLFFFGVTMQNHGGYTYEDYCSTIHIKNREGEYPEAEQYFSLINESDAAFEYLVEYFKTAKEDTLILMFGDHWPALTPEFYKDILGVSDAEEMRNIPFVMWANYDIPEGTDEQTSINYLSTYIYRAAGIHPGYAALLDEIRETIPVVCSTGYYSLEREEFSALSDATGEEKEALEYYQKLQYNNLFDRRHRIDLFERYMQ